WSLFAGKERRVRSRQEPKARVERRDREEQERAHERKPLTARVSLRSHAGTGCRGRALVPVGILFRARYHRTSTYARPSPWSTQQVRTPVSDTIGAIPFP